MAPAKIPSTLQKVKTSWDSVNPEGDSFHVMGSTPAVTPVMLKLATNIGFTEKCVDSLVYNAEEEAECQTPKSEEHKLPPVLCCPPAPLKPKSSLIKRRLSTSPLQGIYVLSDSDIHSLFVSDLAKISRRKFLPECLTEKNLQTSVKERTDACKYKFPIESEEAMGDSSEDEMISLENAEIRQKLQESGVIGHILNDFMPCLLLEDNLP